MKNKLLLIADTAGSLPQELLLEAEEICLVFLSDNAKERKKIEEILIHSGKTYENVNTAKLINEKAYQIRDAFIEWVDLFGEKNEELFQLFKLPTVDINFWYFSLFYEHNSLKTNSFYQLSLLLALSEFVKEKQITHVLINRTKKKEWHKDFIKYNRNLEIQIEVCNERNEMKNLLKMFLVRLKANLHVIYRFCYTKIFLVSRNSNKTLGEKNSTIACTYFPYIDKEALEKGIYINTHYKQLQPALEKEYGSSLGWLGLSIHLPGWSIAKTLEALIKLKNNGIKFDLFEEWINLKDILKILCSFLLISWRRNSIKKCFSQGAVFAWNNEEFSVRDIFIREIEESLSFTYVFETLLRYYAFKNIAEKTKTNVISYFCEEHAWERALCAAFQKSIKIGLQHTITPVLLTNYFRSSRESIQSEKKKISPDFIGCVGETTKQILIKGGHRKESLFTLGAFRFDHDLFTSNKPAPFEGRKNSVVVALSILSHESECFIRFLEAAFSDVAVQLFIKPHPALSLTSTSFEIIGRNRNFFLTQTPLDELCKKAKAMLVTESSSCFYALNEGLPIIIIRLAEYLDLSPLSWTDANFQEYVDSPEELRKTVHRILETKEFVEIRRKEHDFLHGYLDFIKDADEYARRIRKTLNQREVILEPN